MIKGKWVKVMRVVRGMSQEGLANALGISVSVLTSIERGKTVPSDEMEQAIKQALRWPHRADAALFDVLEGKES